jgi:hypothetical protein
VHIRGTVDEPTTECDAIPLIAAATLPGPPREGRTSPEGQATSEDVAYLAELSPGVHSMTYELEDL